MSETSQKPLRVIAHVYTHWAKLNGHTSAFAVFYSVHNGRAPIICADDVSESNASSICYEALGYDVALVIASEIPLWREYRRLHKLFKVSYCSAAEIITLIKKGC